MNVRVYIKSRPAPGVETYRGYVDVVIRDEETYDGEAIDAAGFAAAVKQLKRTSFPDRSASCWKLVRVERL